MSPASDFLDPRLTERRNPRSVGIDVADSLEIVELIANEDDYVLTAVRAVKHDIAKAIDLITDSFKVGGRLIYVGAGTSGRLGVLDASECPPTFGTAPEMVVGIIAGGIPALTRSQEGAEDSEAKGAEAVSELGLTANDFVLGIAASGTTPFVAGAVKEAAQAGATTGFLVCSDPPAEMSQVADLVIAVKVGPEVVTGSTRLKAGTATKMVLNMLTTAAMVRLGKAYGNLMVDLQATNNKLVDRGERMVMEVAGVGREEAKRLVSVAGGKVKTAIVMGKRKVNMEEAVRLLEEAGGVVRNVIGDPPPVISETD